MISKNKVLMNLDSLIFSSIYEVESSRYLDSKKFKDAVIQRMNFFETHYGMNSGQCAILLNNNSISFFIDFLALFFLDAAIIPLDESMHPHDLERIVNFSKANLVIDSNEIRKINSNSQNELALISLILFTSGTTGDPKGVLISKEAILKKMQILHFQIPPKEMENTLCFLPTFFGHGLICNSLFAIFYGKKFYIAKKMTIEFGTVFASFIKEKDINFFSSVPSHWEIILNFSEPYKGPSLKRVHCASAPLNKEKSERILEWLGEIPFYDVYGATEMLGWFASQQIKTNSPTSTFNNFWNVESIFSIERELLIKSDYMFSGYWKKGDSLENGYFNTGDIFNENQIIGRSKNVINKNGIKISTDELNSLFLSSGLLLEVASFPLLDDFKGEDIALFIVLKREHSLEEFEVFCKKSISLIFYPAHIIVIEKIPVNSRNKTSLALLQKTYKELYDN